MDPLRKKLYGSDVFSLLLGSNRQCLTAYAKTISSWVRRTLGIVTYLSGCSLGCFNVGSICGRHFYDIHPEAGEQVSFYPN